MSHPHPELGTPPVLPDGALRVVALGGLGEIGRNMTVFEFEGRLLIVDCGVLFPESEQPGVDLILPDFDYIRDRLDDIDGVEAVTDRLEVREDQVDAGVVVLGEQHPAVDDEQASVVLEDGHVAADLAEAAERDDAQAACGQRRRSRQLGVRMAHRTPAPSRAVRSRAISSSSSGTSGPRTWRLSRTPSSSSAPLAVVAP